MFPALVLATTLLTVPPSTTGAAQNSVDVTASAAGVRLIWSEGSHTIRTTVVEPDGTLDTPIDFNITDTAAWPHVACGGIDCLAVWLDVSASGVSVMGHFVNGPVSFTIAQRGAGTISDLAIAWTGADYVVVWSGTGGGAARISAGGTITALPEPPALRSSWSSPDVVGTSGDALLAWAEWIPQASGLTTTRIDVALASNPAAVTTVATIQVTDNGNAGLRFLRDPRIAFNGSEFVLTWTLQSGPGRGTETHFTRFVKLSDVVTIDESATQFPQRIFFASTDYLIHSLPLWDGTRFRLISGVYDVEERVLLSGATTAAITIGAANSRAPLTVDAAPLTPTAHVLAYTRESISGSDPTQMYVWIVDDPVQRRRAAGR